MAGEKIKAGRIENINENKKAVGKANDIMLLAFNSFMLYIESCVFKFNSNLTLYYNLVVKFWFNNVYFTYATKFYKDIIYVIIEY